MRSSRVPSVLLLALWAALVAGNAALAMHVGFTHGLPGADHHHPHDVADHPHPHGDVDHQHPPEDADHEHRPQTLDPASTARFDAVAATQVPALTVAILPPEMVLAPASAGLDVPVEPPLPPPRSGPIILRI